MNDKENVKAIEVMDRVTLFIQFRFKFTNKEHLKNQTVDSDIFSDSRNCLQWSPDPFPVHPHCLQTSFLVFKLFQPQKKKILVSTTNILLVGT